MTKLRRAAIALDVAMVLAIAWLLSFLVRYALEATPSFDGAMNLNTARSFIEGHGYGFIYDVFFPFPAQTDGPFVLPSALLMLIGGVTPLTTQGVNLAYFIGATILLVILLKCIVRTLTLALAGTLIVLQTPGLFSLGMNGLGEVPMLFWFLLALTILSDTLDADIPSRWRLAAGGMALALCYLTKVVALILVGPAALLFAIAFVTRHRDRAGRLLWFGAGLALPVIGWELFRFVELGGPRAYATWWRLQLWQVRQQSGASETTSLHVRLWAKGLEHLRILADLVAVPEPLVLCFLFVPWLASLGLLLRRWRQRQFGTAFCIAACGAGAVLYFVWWLLITPTGMAWLRRILDGLLLQQVLLAIVLAVLARALWRGALSGRFGILFATVLAAALLWPETYLMERAAAFTRPLVASDIDREQLALAEKLRELPADATLFGIGWWQAPVLALFSDRQVMNYERWDPAKIAALPHKYLVLDYVAKALADKPELQRILAAGSSHIVADGTGGTIYQLDEVLPYAPFTEEDRQAADLGTGFDSAIAPYPHARGFLSAKGDWVRPDSAVLFLRTDQVRLSLSVDIPAGLVSTDDKVLPRLHVTSPGCLDATVPFDQPGSHTFSLPLTCPPASTPQPMEIWFHLNGHLPFVRQIDADSRPFAFAFAAAQLQSGGSP
jgi:hypothetical protein